MYNLVERSSIEACAPFDKILLKKSFSGADNLVQRLTERIMNPRVGGGPQAIKVISGLFSTQIIDVHLHYGIDSASNTQSSKSIIFLPGDARPPAWRGAPPSRGPARRRAARPVPAPSLRRSARLARARVAGGRCLRTGLVGPGPRFAPRVGSVRFLGSLAS